MKRYGFLALVLIFLVSCSGEGGRQHAFHKALRLGDGKVVPFEEMIDDLKRTDIVFIGESHDSKKDHQAELDIISALHKQGARPAIGLEMFRSESQNILDGWTSGTIDKDKFIRSYYDNWRIPWPFYRDIFLYAREKRIPMVGLNIPDNISEKVAEKGFDSLGRDELAKLPPSISCDVDPSYMDFIENAYAAHDMKKERFVYFCEAQMLWDKAMAWHLIGYMKKNPGRKMIVLAGSGHSWKRGIPEQLRRTVPYTFKVVLPSVQDGIDGVTKGDADYVLVDKP